jgi:hypothetical protein
MLNTEAENASPSFTKRRGSLPGYWVTRLRRNATRALLEGKQSEIERSLGEPHECDGDHGQ